MFGSADGCAQTGRVLRPGALLEWAAAAHDEAAMRVDPEVMQQAARVGGDLALRKDGAAESPLKPPPITATSARVSPSSGGND